VGELTPISPKTPNGIKHGNGSWQQKLALLSYLKLKKSQAKAVLDFLYQYPTRPKNTEREQRKRDFDLVKTKLKSLKTDKHYVR